MVERREGFLESIPRIRKLIEAFLHCFRVGQVCKSVQQVQMGFRLQQAVMFMLAIDVHQCAAHFGEQSERTEAAVQVNSISTRTIENPLNDQFAACFESCLAELGLDR